MLGEKEFEAIAKNEVDDNPKYREMFKDAQKKSREITAPEKEASAAPEKKNQGRTL